jgi:hypothetical protein
MGGKAISIVIAAKTWQIMIQFWFVDVIQDFVPSMLEIIV